MNAILSSFSSKCMYGALPPKRRLRPQRCMTTPATIATTSANTTTAPTIAKIKVSFESSSDDDFCPGAIVTVFVDDRCNDDDVAERVVFVAVVDDEFIFRFVLFFHRPSQTEPT